IRIRVFALTLFIQGRSRMREIRSYGSVRGVVGDRYPYRDSQFFFGSSVGPSGRARIVYSDFKDRRWTLHLIEQ
ncbi:MAG: hypothetical protein ABSF54_27970, partial [Bryobacteraceae bacterium]